MTITTNRLLRTVLSLALACAAAAPAFAGEQDFDRAIESYRMGRVSDAYGRFLALAYQGDPDAARIVLFLGENGALLHGKQWELTPEDSLALRRTATRPSLRQQAALETVGYDSTGRRHVMGLQQAAQGH